MKTYTEYRLIWWHNSGVLAEEDYIGNLVSTDKRFMEDKRDEKLARPFDEVHLMSRQITEWENV